MEKIAEERKIVMVADICSSSDIIEDLTLTNNIEYFHAFLSKTTDFLKDNSKKHNFEIYKFTGDGWILLFDPEVSGNTFFYFLKSFASDYRRRFYDRLMPLFEVEPTVKGLTFGSDRGILFKVKLQNKWEYIGRPINIACRLQSAVKERDDKPAYKMLMSNHLFKSFEKTPDEEEGYVIEKRRKRTLRNIRGGKEYICVRISLPIAAR